MRLLAALLLLLLAAPAGAATIVLDFEDEVLGNRGTSFASAECGGCVTLSSEQLEVGDFQHQSDGIGLLVGEDDGADGLWLDFAAPVTALSLAFGNDATPDPEEHTPSDPAPGDVARLRAYLGGSLVGEAIVVQNQNDVMDQVIALAGIGAFDRAHFVYVAVGLDEIVDNITFTTVPEAGTLGLGFVALALFACRRVG